MGKVCTTFAYKSRLLRKSTLMLRLDPRPTAAKLVSFRAVCGICEIANDKLEYCEATTENDTPWAHTDLEFSFEGHLILAETVQHLWGESINHVVNHFKLQRG